MKNYYYNPKSRDLTIFDAETKEILVLERIEGIRVLTRSEIDHPTDDDGRLARPRFSGGKTRAEGQADGPLQELRRGRAHREDLSEETAVSRLS